MNKKQILQSKIIWYIKEIKDLWIETSKTTNELYNNFLKWKNILITNNQNEIDREANKNKRQNLKNEIKKYKNTDWLILFSSDEIRWEFLELVSEKQLWKEQIEKISKWEKIYLFSKVKNENKEWRYKMLSAPILIENIIQEKPNNIYYKNKKDNIYQLLKDKNNIIEIFELNKNNDWIKTKYPKIYIKKIILESSVINWFINVSIE